VLVVWRKVADSCETIRGDTGALYVRKAVFGMGVGVYEGMSLPLNSIYIESLSASSRSPCPPS
jgi:hypothetical protein